MQRSPSRYDAVLFDRDGTLVVDVPYNGDPDKVEPVDGAREALERLRRAGLRVGLVTNQSGIAKRRFGVDDMHAVHARLEALLGPFDVIAWCPHDDSDRCECRKPKPGLVRRAADTLGVDTRRCAVVGDTRADVDAALAAGAQPILVPNDVTLPSEIATAPVVTSDVRQAVALILGATNG